LTCHCCSRECLCIRFRHHVLFLIYLTATSRNLRHSSHHSTHLCRCPQHIQPGSQYNHLGTPPLHGLSYPASSPCSEHPDPAIHWSTSAYQSWEYSYAPSCGTVMFSSVFSARALLRSSDGHRVEYDSGSSFLQCAHSLSQYDVIMLTPHSAIHRVVPSPQHEFSLAFWTHSLLKLICDTWQSSSS
jgi:hypothetical protein